MADKRMFSRKILGSTQFLEMPPQSQALYIQLCMDADDDGFVNNLKLIQKMIGFQPKFGKVLIQNGYILEIKQDLHVITHWWIHNKRDRNNQKPTIYQEALQTLDLDDDKVYRIKGENQSGISLKSVGNQSVKKNKIKEDKIKENNKSVCKEADDEYYAFYDSEFIKPLLEGTERYKGYPKAKIDKKTSYDLWLRRVNDMDTDMVKSSRIIGSAIWRYFRDFEDNGGNPVYLFKLSSLLGDKWKDKIEPYLQQAITMHMDETKKEEPAMNLWDEEKEMTDEEWLKMMQESDWE